MGTYVTDTGFIKKRQDQIKSDLETSYKQIYGPNVNLNPQSSNGQEIGIYSESMADIWDLLEVLYQLGNPGSSRGRTQELLYTLNGITRNQATASTATLTISGNENTLVEAGFQAETDLGLRFETIEDVLIGVSGNVNADSECTITGPNVAVTGSITNIVTPQSGVTSVTNAEDATPGKSQEKDTEFRLRRKLSTSLPGENVLESLYAQLADLSDVRAVRIYQNRTSIIDDNGLPPHSFMPIVDGGDDDDIANIVWLNTSGGVGSVGDETVEITDPNGFPVDVEFQRPVEKEIYVDITLEKLSNYPTDGDTTIRQNIVDFAAGLLDEETGFSGFNIGQDIYRSRLYQPVNLVQGHSITSLKIGLSWISVAEVDLDLGFKEKGIFDTTRIKINGDLGL